MSGRIELLRLLADGALHSGEELAARAFGLARRGLEAAAAARGVGHRARGAAGPRLPARVADRPARCRPTSAAALPPVARDRLRHLEVHEALDSTSDRLLAVDDLPPGRFDACLAEFQSAGRGRRGRRWVAPFASGLCLSVNWNYRDAPATLAALSLAAGVAALRALERLGIGGLSLKWPNDIVPEDRKLGGHPDRPARRGGGTCLRRGRHRDQRATAARPRARARRSRACDAVDLADARRAAARATRSLRR